MAAQAGVNPGTVFKSALAGWLTASRKSALGSAARLSLIIAAQMGFPVVPALRCALALVQLRGFLVTQLVGVVFDLAGLGRLFVTRVLFVRHDGFLVMDQQSVLMTR